MKRIKQQNGASVIRMVRLNMLGGAMLAGGMIGVSGAEVAREFKAIAPTHKTPPDGEDYGAVDAGEVAMVWGGFADAEKVRGSSDMLDAGERKTLNAEKAAYRARILAKAQKRAKEWESEVARLYPASFPGASVAAPSMGAIHAA